MINNMITLSSGNVEVDIDVEYGSRLSSVRFGGTELLVQRTNGDSFSWGCYPMAPWAGRIRNGPLGSNGVVIAVPLYLGVTECSQTEITRQWMIGGYRQGFGVQSVWWTGLRFYTDCVQRLVVNNPVAAVAF